MNPATVVQLLDMDDFSVGKEVLTAMARGCHVDTAVVEECMEGTRLDVLQKVRDWIEDNSAPNILWIFGYPGVGKSAIAGTVASHLRERRRLGSAFFFRKDIPAIMTSRLLWQTVSIDLSRRYPAFRNALAAKLTLDVDLPLTSNNIEFFKQLVCEPLVACRGILEERAPVILVDALDECGGFEGHSSDPIKGLFGTLRYWATLPREFKIIVTSRDETDIRRVLSGISRPLEVHAGKTATQQSLNDIYKFFEEQFQELSNRYPSLTGWPNSKVL